MPKGKLVAIGGNEDKEDDMVILRRVIEEVKGDASRVEVVAAASRDPREASRPYLRAFEDMRIRHVDALDVQGRREADERRTIDRLAEADVIYFTGGDQTRLSETLRGTKALDAIRERYEAGAVIAGTSAGAAAMSSTMLARGRSEEGLNKGNVEISPGLGLLPNTIIDTHFIQRGRFTRLLEAVTHHPELVGIGISEDTAFILHDGRYLEVEGSDNVIVVDGSEIKHTNTREAREGDVLTVEHAVVHALAEGYWFDLEERSFYSPKKAEKEVPV